MTAAPARLTPAQLAQFATHGFISPVEALSAVEGAECERRLVAALAATGGHADVRMRNNPHLLLRWMNDLMRDPRVVEPMADLLGPNLLVLRTALFVKVPHDHGTIAWHQDLAYWELSSDRSITVWLALTDSTPENGCVRVVAGSHHGPLLDHRLGRDQYNRLVRGQLVDIHPPPERVVDLELRAGQLSVHHGRLLHSSPANPSPRLRAGLAVRFVSPDVRQGGPRGSATLVRGVDTYGYYDHEPVPRFDGDPIARAWHRRSLRRYATHVLWQIVRHPGRDHLALLARLAMRGGFRALWR